MYGNTTLPDDLDLVTGGMLESTASGPGQTFRMIILEQFSRIRNGDRLWFENNVGPNRYMIFCKKKKEKKKKKKRKKKRIFYRGRNIHQVQTAD